jgi:hypothetical protein
MLPTASQPTTAADNPTADLEASVDEVIALCDGDMRTAIRSLFVANAYLEEETDRLREAVSLGYVRGMLNDPTARAKLWRG